MFQLVLFADCPKANPPSGNLPELWLQLTEFPRYDVSSYGRFRNRRNCRILKGRLAHDGYMHIGLIKNGHQRWKLAHRLVATAFLDNPSNFPVVNHIDMNRRNNRVDNLEWTSYRGNAIHWLRIRRPSQ